MTIGAGIFSRKLLLTESPITVNLPISREKFEFHEPDCHHKNVIHGKMINCPSLFTSSSPVSCMLFSECAQALVMKDHLETLNNFVGVVGSVIKTYGVMHLEITKPSATLFQFGAQAPFSHSEIMSNEHIVLVTGQIPPTTFEDWLKRQPRHKDALILFRDLFRIMKKLHKKNMYIGNVRAGIRISGNKPMLVFPAKSDVMDLDEGIWSDLRELRKMVNEAMPDVTFESILFNDLCDQYAGDVSSVSELKYRDGKLREGSFLILSSPIIWNSSDRYDFVRKLGEYRSLDTHTYDYVVRDIDPHDPTIPNIKDWYTRLENAAPKSVERKLYKVYAFDRYLYTTATEAIRYFHSCVYEHLKTTYKDHTDVSDMLYQTFPEVPSALYKMMIDKLYHRTCENDPMPLVMDFFWKEPHCFDPKI